MPLYTYACQDHGEFSAWSRMAESDAPQPCPSCTGPAQRALARPALGGRASGEAAINGAGDASGCMAEAPSLGGACCGGGACMH